MLKPREYIRKLLLSGLTETDIAAVADVSQSTIYRIKSGFTPNPRIDTAEKLRQIYLKHCNF